MHDLTRQSLLQEARAECVRHPRIPRALWWAVFCSLLVHLAWVGLLLLDALPRLHMPIPSVPAASAPPKLRLVMPPPSVPATEERFIRTDGMAETDPQENARFVSDRDTRLASREQGKLDSAMPSQTGARKPGLSVVERPDLRPSDLPPEPGSPPAPEVPPRPPEPDVTPSPNEAAQAAPTLPAPLAIRPMAAPSQEHSQTPPRPEMPPPAATPPQPRVAAAPATPFSFREEKSALEGGAAPMGDSSVDAKATPLGKYKAKVYNLIGSQWRFMVSKQASMLNYGTVSIRFLIRANGALAEVHVLGNSSGSAMLQTISEQSIRLVAPLPPFPPSVREQVGDTYSMDVNFTIY